MLALLLALGPAQANRLTVDATGAGDFTDLQDALNAAVPGDYIALEAGSYTRGTLNGWDGPIIGLAPTGQVVIEAGSMDGLSATDPAALDLRHLVFQGGRTGVEVDGGLALLQDVRILGATVGIDAGGDSTLLVENLLIGDCVDSLELESTQLYLSQATLLDASTLLTLNASGELYLFNSILDDAVQLASCSSASSILELSYSLSGPDVPGSVPTCTTLDHVLLGYDPGFVDYSSDRDFDNDDLSLAPGSVAIDAGHPDCLEPDGTVCDLGYTGGPGATRADDDGDRMADDWELEVGLDPGLDDAAIDDDGDGLDNLGEYLFGTDPFLADTDGDGAGDHVELQASLDPLDPSDQSPTAVLTGERAGFLGEPYVIDGSDSSDPLDDPLSYTWRFDFQPAGSVLVDADLGSAPTASFTPDVTGEWNIQLVVDDGTNSDTEFLQVTVLRDRIILIPDDFATWDDIAVGLADGMEVWFSAGNHQVVATVDRDVVLRGAGPEATTLYSADESEVLAVVGGAHVQLSDLNLSAVAASVAVSVSERSWLDVSDATVSAIDGGTAISVTDSALTAWHLETSGAVTGSSAELWLASSEVVSSSTAAVHLVRSELGAAGVHLLAAGSSSYALYADSSVATLENATVTSSGLPSGTDVGIYLDGWGALVEANHLYLAGGRPAVQCEFLSEARLDHVVAGGVSTLMEDCDYARPPRVAYDATAPEESGRPADGSVAIDGGDPRLTDPDGSVRDIGAYGGPRGLGVEAEVEDPDADLDGDGLRALVEWMIGSSDSLVDTDGDGWDDLYEHLAADDPGDPGDHHPAVEFRNPRVQPGETAVLAPIVGPDPEGESCEFAWDSGSSLARSFRSDEPGVHEFGWTLSCGAGQSSGSARVVVEEPLLVPGDAETVSEALAIAEDWHAITLAAGRFEEDVDLGDRPVALRGEGRDTVIVGDVSAEGADAVIEDLTVRGDVWTDGPALAGLAVFGQLTNGSGALENVLVDDGDLELLDSVALAFATVDGALIGVPATGDFLAVTGDLWAGWFGGCGTCYASSGTGGWGLLTPETDFILTDPDPDVAILEPWPQSALWDQSASDPLDVDGSAPDAGYTGGPLAWPTDTDLDTMNDRWEALHQAFEPDEDLDGDTLDNATEFRRGSDPNNRDTDGDRIPDNEDPTPYTPSDTAIEVSVSPQPVVAELGERVALSATVFDPLGNELTEQWSVTDPEGIVTDLDDTVGTPGFVLDREGTWLARVTVTAADGASTTVERPVHSANPVAVASTDSLQVLVDFARDGDKLILEGPSYELSGPILRDLIITAAEGASATTIATERDSVMATLAEGRWLRFEGVTLNLDDSVPGIDCQDSYVGLRRVQVRDGRPVINANNCLVEIESSILLDAPAVVTAQYSELRIGNAVIGWPGTEVIFDAISLFESTAYMHSSIVWWPEEATVVDAGRDSSAVLTRSFLIEGEDVSGDVTVKGVRDDDPMFVVSPSDLDDSRDADLRLQRGSPAIDAGDLLVQDPDGSRTDIGVFGGPYADWIDVDNDRDGYDNLEGDCDDFDVEVFPDRFTGACGETTPGCTGCAASTDSTPWWWLLTPLLAMRRRSGGPSRRDLAAHHAQSRRLGGG